MTAGTTYFNLGPRLTLTFGALIVLILGGNALVVWQFRTARNQTDRLTGANQQLIEVLRLQASLLSFHRRLDELARAMDAHRLVTEAEASRRALREQTQQIRTAIANLPSATVVDPAFLPTLDTIDVTLAAEVEDIFELAESGEWGAIQLRLANELNPVEIQTAILVNNFNQQASEDLARGVAEMGIVEHRILVIVSATALSTFFIATFFGWSIARHMIELRFEERVNERTRIARELHDTLLQSFHGVLMKFHAGVHMIRNRPDDAEKMLERTLEQAEQAIVEGRDAVQGLRSSTFVSSDLARAIRLLGAELADQEDSNSPEFQVDVQGTPPELAPIVREEVYHIAGEAVRNAFEHAQATRIEVEIRYDQRQLRLRVRDDGKGIDPEILEAGARAGHYGLPGLQERAKLVRGKLTVCSESGSGTEIELTIPASIAYLPASGRHAIFQRKSASWVRRPRGG